MTLRTSKAPAACRFPVPFPSLLIAVPPGSAEDDVEEGHHGQRDAGQLRRRPVPGQPGKFVGGRFQGRRLAFGAVRFSLGRLEEASPGKPSTGFRLVTCVTTTL